MPSNIALVGAGTVALSAAISTWLAVYAARRRDVPGALSLSLFGASVAVWAAAYAGGLLTYDPVWRPVWEQVAWVGRATVGVWFLLFALAYTGHDGVVTRRRIAGLLVVPVTTIALVWTNSWHELIWVGEQTVRVEFGMALVISAVGPAFWASVAYTYLLVAAGGILLVRLIPWSDYLYVDQSALLLIGIAAPFAGSAFTVLPPHPILGFDYTPYAFAVTGLTFGYALFRRRLFELVPATRVLGSNPAISQLDDGVLVLDGDRRIVYCNEAAGGILGQSPPELFGEPSEAVVDESRLEFGTQDALAELERDGRVYEVRTSPITDANGQEVGHTLLFHDVTARERREQRLRQQRDELADLEELNGIIRGVNQALVSARSREDVERAVCERMAESDRYATICVADIATWTGETDRWTVCGATERTGMPAVDGEVFGTDERRDDPETRDSPPSPEADGGWIVVPIVYGRTVYGAIGLNTARTVGDRERAVLGELGEMVGHAVNATETRQLLAGDSVVELELRRDGGADPFVVAAEDADCRLELAGVVPREDEAAVYLRAKDGDVTAVVDGLAAAPGSAGARGDDTNLVAYRPDATGLLGTVLDWSVNVTGMTVNGRRTTYELEVASETTARSLVTHLEEAFPDVTLESKRVRESVPGTSQETLPEDLTDRQREVLQTAYRSGYFEWPRDSTAEDVADTLDIAASTFHAHVRKAENRLLADIFGDDRDDS